MPACCSAVRTADQVGGLADYLERLAEVGDLFGARVEHRHQMSSSPTDGALGTITTPLRLNR